MLDVRASGARRALLRRVPGDHRGHPRPDTGHGNSGCGFAIPDARFGFASGVAQLRQIKPGVGFLPGILAGDGRVL